ncbi:hypothetical protein EPUS_08227 [Endocarpon pusillum Z07020]|uniref:Vacuolar ATPase assembly protein VMA22 n=1 Tax=Endocarpon pusillum (strain Z07020 / HMAS-L-300199) TaxID=1263415 RepID=U1GJ95_ENDPU|nr:uncharacterized protein EPUS_08227 [Endocarpon pusillum Z07020]ERF71911.1 hypothetical protein EPUS_08227 [Endocarpon pusillum Z07020]
MSKPPVLPTPPASSTSTSTSSSPSPPNAQETSDPISRLDALLEIYLDRLDTYQTLRAELSQTFSAGFLSLAPPLRRGGIRCAHESREEGEDPNEGQGRRRSHSSGGTIRYTTTEQLIPAGEDPDDTTPHSPVPSEMTAQALISPRDEKPSSTRTADPNTNTRLPRTSPSSLSPTQPPDHTTNPHPRSKSKSKKPPNPLNWYGVLVPASLRAAQTSFACAVGGPIPHLLNIQLEMTDLESRIRKLRAEAGLTRLTGQDDADDRWNADAER